MSSARILTLLALADEAPEPDELTPYLTDPEPEVRRTALTVLSETTEDWERASAPVAEALRDTDRQVRHTAAELLAELREVLVAGPEFEAALRNAATSTEPDVRTAAVANLWRHRLMTTADAHAHLADPHDDVRVEAVLALVSLRADAALTDAVTDPSAPVRTAVARGLGSIGDPRGAATLTELTSDPDQSVRTAALSALAETGCPAPSAERAISALADPYWRTREAAAKALAAAPHHLAAEPLASATSDDNLDVRKAAVRSLQHLIAEHPSVLRALHAATEDPDADVRAYARLAIANHTER